MEGLGVMPAAPKTNQTLNVQLKDARVWGTVLSGRVFEARRG